MRGYDSRRSFLGMSRGVLIRTDDARSMQEAQASIYAGERLSGIERFEPFGFSAHAPAGSEALIGFPGGDRSHPVILAAAMRGLRPVGAGEGDVVVYDARGQVQRFSADGFTVMTDLPVRVVSQNSVLIDVRGMPLKVSEDRIDIGGDPAPFRVSTEGGYSNVVYAAISPPE